MPLFRSNNWRNFFHDNPENKASNETIDTLMELFGQDTSLDDCLSNGIEEQNTIFMTKAPFSGDIAFLHHVSKIGGTRTSRDKKIFALVGVGDSCYPAQLTKEALFEPFESKTPTWAAISTADELTNIDNLPARSRKTLRPCMPLPPFLASALIDMGTASPNDLLIETLRRIKSFDQAIGEDDSLPKASDHLQLIALWLWSVTIDDFPSVTTTPSTDRAIIEKSEEIHEKWLLPTQTQVIPATNTQPSNALSQLASNVNEQTAILQQLNNLAEERSREKAKSKGLDAIHPSFKTMILAASSSDGTNPAQTPTPECTAFFNQKSAVHAKIHLLQTLTYSFGCTVDISVPLATALYHGNFLWDKPDSPNNFCSLLFGKPSPLATTGAKEAMILHLKAEKGGGWSDKDLDKALRQAIAIPTTIDGMLHNISNFTAASRLFFGEDSTLTIGLNSWRPQISTNLISYESQSLNDNTFIASVLTSIDTRVNCWLQDCATKPFRCNVDDELVDFTDIQKAIRIRQFSFTLPPSIRSHISSSSKRQDPPSNLDDGREQKRQPIQNPKKNNRWKLRDGEDYREIFADKHIGKRPSWNGVNICPRWHIRGVCFSGCNLSETHREITDPELRRQMDTYCKLCRGE